MEYTEYTEHAEHMGYREHTEYQTQQRAHLAGWQTQTHLATLPIAISTSPPPLLLRFVSAMIELCYLLFCEYKDGFIKRANLLLYKTN